MSGVATSLFKLLDPAKHSVLIFASGFDHAAINAISSAVIRIPSAKETVQSLVILHEHQQSSGGGPAEGFNAVKYDDMDVGLADRDGHAYSGYAVKDGEPTIVIIRPDGYIGAILRDHAGIENYFSKVFL